MSRLIAFDVDSTLLSVESLDFAIAEAARSRGESQALAAKIEAITAAGMDGRMDFTASLAARLDIGRLDRGTVEQAARALVDRTLPGMDALLGRLRESGDRVVAVSGGFRELIGPALARLDFTPDAVFANDFIWSDGRASGFDRDNPLSRNGGKARLVRSIRPPAIPAIMVGDGMTDYEAYADGAVDRFIGFGAVARRQAVEDKAEFYALSVDDLASLLLEIRA